MKKFLLSSLALFSLFIIGCDTNVYQPIMINQDFDLTYINDAPYHFTSDTNKITNVIITESFTHSIVGNKLILKNTFALGNPGLINTTSALATVNNSTSEITLTYKEILATNPYNLSPTNPVPSKIAFEARSYFNINKIRMGTGKKLKVNIVYDFPNTNTNVLRLTNKSYTLPY